MTTTPTASPELSDLDHLEALARAATPGPWSWWTSNSTLRLTGADGRDGGVLYGYARQGDGDVNCAPNDQAFIAAANPAAVLDLISLARRAQPEREAPQAEPEPMNTQSSRQYLVEFMEKHFTDKTYHRYIRGEATRNGLAGDFAWQMARALRMLAAAPGNPPEIPDGSTSAPGTPEAPSDKHLPYWERGIATVTLSGHQLREALDFINPDGEGDPDQLDDDLTFGIVPHEDDEGKAKSSMCCWNDDTDGVLPLDSEPRAAQPANTPEAPKGGA